MIEIILIAVPLILFGALIGLLIGQYNVWKMLRKKGSVTIDGWIYIGERESDYIEDFLKHMPKR